VSDEPGYFAINRHPTGAEDLMLDLAVSQVHIDGGKRQVCTECPVALALLDTCQEYAVRLAANVPVAVQADYATLCLDDGRVYLGQLPYYVREFIRHFDRGPDQWRNPFAIRIGFELLEGPSAQRARDHHASHAENSCGVGVNKVG
jgi:hypothetical protein